MDLNTVNEIIVPNARSEIPARRPGDAFLAGGTWLFSEPQIEVTRLVDLTRLGWDELAVADGVLQIGATCTIASLAAFEPPADWLAGPLILQCCRALLGSFKIWNMATVGGNLCMALPAGPMTSLMVALAGDCVVWTKEGGERVVAAKDFVTGPQQNALRPGEMLRRIDVPLAALRRRAVFRQISLSPAGRSGALLIGTTDGDDFVLTVTAATRRPVQLAFPTVPDETGLSTRLSQESPEALYYDDVHGKPDWRRHMTFVFAEQIRRAFTRP